MTRPHPQTTSRILRLALDLHRAIEIDRDLLPCLDAFQEAVRNHVASLSPAVKILALLVTRELLDEEDLPNLFWEELENYEKSLIPKKKGRPRYPIDVQKAERALRECSSVRKAAKKLNVPQATLFRWLRRQDAERAKSSLP